MEVVRQLALQKRDRQVQSASRMAAIVVALLALIVIGGIAFSFRSKIFPSSATSATAGPTQKPTPTGVAGFLMSLPTPVVQAAPSPAFGGTPSRCPGSTQEAASLFGGQASDWTYKPDAGGWIMTTIKAQTVQVPAGMLAGYLQFGEGGANMSQVDGPATIRNVNFVAITCQ